MAAAAWWQRRRRRWEGRLTTMQLPMLGKPRLSSRACWSVENEVYPTQGGICFQVMPLFMNGGLPRTHTRTERRDRDGHNCLRGVAGGQWRTDRRVNERDLLAVPGHDSWTERRPRLNNSHFFVCLFRVRVQVRRPLLTLLGQRQLQLACRRSEARPSCSGRQD